MEQANNVQGLILWIAAGFLATAITLFIIYRKEIFKEIEEFKDSDIRKGFNDSSIHDTNW